MLKIGDTDKLSRYDHAVNLVGTALKLCRELEEKYQKIYDQYQDKSNPDFSDYSFNSEWAKIKNHYYPLFEELVKKYSYHNNLNWDENTISAMITMFISLNPVFKNLVKEVMNVISYSSNSDWNKSNWNKQSSIENNIDNDNLDYLMGLVAVLYPIKKKFEKEFYSSNVNAQECYDRYDKVFRKQIDNFFKLRGMRLELATVYYMSRLVLNSNSVEFEDLLSSIESYVSYNYDQLFKKASTDNNVAFNLCGVLYPINRQFTKDWVSDTSGNKEPLLSSYYDKFYETIKKYSIDNKLNWGNDILSDLTAEILDLGGHDFGKMLDKIIFILKYNGVIVQ